MASNGHWKTCPCGCGRRFRTKFKRQKYFDKGCKNRVGQRELRKRARMYPERQAEQVGAGGGN